MRVLAVVGGVIALLIIVPVLIMYAAGIGIFSAKVQAVIAKKTINNRVTAQVFNPTNKIQSQGYFEGLNADVNGYVQNIQIQRALVKSDPSPYNETNLAGIEQECVNAVEEYNSAANSISSEAFRSADLPPSLDPSVCA